MTKFCVAGVNVYLPAITVVPRAPSRDTTAWWHGLYMTVRLLAPVVGLRVHTNGRSYPGRDASFAEGKWVAIGDVIQTASELASSRSLPVNDPRRMVAFTRVSEAHIPPRSVLNIGLASAKFGRNEGGGFQAEFVEGPVIQAGSAIRSQIRFVQLSGKHWHGLAGNA